MSWEEIYSLLIADTGWTWEYIAENMTLPRLRAMDAYREEHPTIQSMLAAYLGIKSKSNRKQGSSPSPAPIVPEDKRGNPTKEAPANLGQAAAMLGGRVIRPPKRRYDGG